MTGQEIDVLSNLLSDHSGLTPHLAQKRILKKLRDCRIRHPAPEETRCPACRGRGQRGVTLRWATMKPDEGWWCECEKCGAEWREETEEQR